MNPPIIVSAAMLMKNGDIVVGIRHFSPEMRSIMLKAYGEGYHLQVKIQGFVDQYGTFYDRKEAWKIADKMGQIRRPTGWEGFDTPRPANIGDEGILFSENLY
jgi:hypothetical protein